MLEALATSVNEEACTSAGNSFAFGVSQLWPHQQLGEFGNVHVAVDADFLNIDELRTLAAGAENSSPPNTLADTVASLYLGKGVDFLNLLRGSFSIAIWDDRNQRLLLAIDHLGINNVYYSLGNEGLFFSSRSSAIVKVQDSPAEVNPDALVQFLVLSVVPAPLSIFRGVERLQPGCFLIYERGQLRTARYWDVQYHEGANHDVQHWATKVRGELREAVRATAAGNALEGTGAYLSGGTDSSTVVAFLNELHPPANTFSVWFDDPRYSEIGFARTTAQAFRTRHVEKCVSPEDAQDAIPKILQYYDEPFANSSAVGTYWCARMACEQGMQVLLGGDGGDELFAGNERYASDKIFQLYNSLPTWVRHTGIEPLASFLPSSSVPRRFLRRAQIRNPRRVFSRTLFLSMDPGQVFEPGLLDAFPTEHWLQIPEAHFDRAPAQSELNRLMYLDLKITLADNDLRKVVGTAEMAGVRVRFPLLERRLVEFSATIPTPLKMKRWQKRYIFKQAMTGILPERVLYKKKHGFGVPLGKWLLDTRGLGSMVGDILSDARTRQRGYFRPAFLDKLRNLHGEHAPYYGEIIWYLLVLELWHRQHLELAQGVRIGN